MDIKIAGIDFNISFNGVCKHITIKDRVTFHGPSSGYDAGKWLASEVHSSVDFESFLNTVDDDDGNVLVEIIDNGHDKKMYEEIICGYSIRYNNIVNGT